MLITCASAEEFTLSRGNLPILLVSGHGGSQELPGAPVRDKKLTEDPNFTLKKDLVTDILAASYLQEIEKAFEPEQKPSLLISRIHRKYVDMNRERSLASHHQKGRAAHRRFHDALQKELSRIEHQHGWVLLIDIHGQSALALDLCVGTRFGQTTTPWSDTALWAEDGILAQLRREGFTTAPDSPQQQHRYSGGYIVAHYGVSHSVEAWQFEHGQELRFDQQRQNSFISIVARGLRHWIPLRKTP